MTRCQSWLPPAHITSAATTHRNRCHATQAARNTRAARYLQPALDELHRADDHAVHKPGEGTGTHNLPHVQRPEHGAVGRVRFPLDAPLEQPLGLWQASQQDRHASPYPCPCNQCACNRTGMDTGARTRAHTRNAPAPPTWPYDANTTALTSGTVTSGLAMPAGKNQRQRHNARRVTSVVGRDTRAAAAAAAGPTTHPCRTPGGLPC